MFGAERGFGEKWQEKRLLRQAEALLGRISEDVQESLNFIRIMGTHWRVNSRKTIVSRYKF